MSDASPALAPDTSPRDPWHALTQFTAARIALGRTGGSARTDTRLAFQLAHARARDAVTAPFEASALAAELAAAGLAAEPLATLANERRTYLLRPDLGRELAPHSREHLRSLAAASAPCDLAIIVSDGLAAHAAQRHAVATLLPLVSQLRSAGWSLHPIFVVPLARVKLQDAIGETLRVRHTLMLLGERPGLTAPDSLGAYFTFQPRATCTDADRNCVSNIRPEGLPPAAAARKLAELLLESARRRTSGIALKDVAVSPGRLSS